MESNQPIKCIIVEDFPELNSVYTNILNHESDIDVVDSIFSGAMLEESIRINKPDVILMDIEMESPTAGIDFCWRIHQIYPEIRIVILTGHEEEGMIVSAFEAGAVDYILKTDSMSDIISSIRKAYDQTSPIHSYAAKTIRKKMREIGNYKEALQVFTRSFMRLTPAEVGILKLILKGYKQKEIAAEKHVELVTVKTHVSHILKKFQVRRANEIIEMIRTLDLDQMVQSAESI